MAGLGLPWWLIALAVIPVIRWLHRWQAPLSETPVSAVFLWNAAGSAGSGGEVARKPEVAWRRRALIAALLIVALAEPWWQRSSGPVTVWIDDSLSMSAIEQDDTRLANGLVSLEQKLRESDARSVSLRSLSDPAMALGGDDPRAFEASTWLAASPGNPQPPPAALLNPDAAHWLLTDGADERLAQWAVNAPLAQVIAVGEVTENTAVTRLAARPGLEIPGSVHVLISVSNQGHRDAIRSLNLESGGGILETRMLTLRAGETRHLTATYDLGDDGLTASLVPSDAVPLDDSLVLASSAIARVPVHLDAGCPKNLSMAITLHPVLVSVATSGNAQLQVMCSDGPMIADAILRVHTSVPEPATGPLDWQPGAGRLQALHLPQEWISVAAWDAEPEGEFETVLATDEKPLVIHRKGPMSVVETVLDMSSPTFSRQPEYAAVVAGLIDLALNRPLLDSAVKSTIDPTASRIAPSKPPVRTFEGPSHGVTRQSLTNMFLAFAVLVLLADIILVWRARREARRA